MERIIRRLLLIWLLLLAGVLVAQHFGYVLLAYWLLWAVAIGSPVVVALLLALVALGLRDAWRRLRVLHRARHWRRKEATQRPDGWWMEK